MPQRILIAPAAFKGTLGPRQVADALAAGARRALPDADVRQCPISDGGDGLLDAVLAPTALRERISVTGPLGEPVSGELGWVDPETAIFESATACGVALLKPEQLDPLRATTRGVGELLWEAVERGAKTVVVAWAARRRWMAERAPPEVSAGPSETPREGRFRREVARWRSWRSSTGGGVWTLGSSHSPMSPRRWSARGAQPRCSDRRRERDPKA